MTVKTNPVVWFELYVQDMARARAFYETVLGTTLSSLDTPDLEMLAFPGDPQAGGAAGALVRMDGFPSGGNSTLVYFRSDDCAIETARVVAAGGRIQRDKMSLGPYGFCSLVFDTEGNLFGLHSMA